MDIYIYIFTKIVSLRLNFLYLLPLNPLILGSFTSTNKSTPCIRFVIEDPPLKKKERKNKRFVFKNSNKSFFLFSTTLQNLKAVSRKRSLAPFSLLTFLLNHQNHHPLRAIQFPIQPDPSCSPPLPYIVPQVRYLAGININRLAA